MNPLLPPSKASTATFSTSTAVDEATPLSTLPPDVIESHILVHLDGPSLASASCSSAALHHLSSQYQLWTQLCHATWPSTASLRLTEIISAFPHGGPGAFFAQSFPLPVLDTTPAASSHRIRLPPPEEFISAVDIRYKDDLIFSKVQMTETVSRWFRCSPFRVDLLDTKDVVPTRIKHPERDDTCLQMFSEMSLSWILVDAAGQRAVNLSSHRPVSVQRHWLNEDVEVRYSSILSGAIKKSHVQCGIVVTCGRSDGGELQLREVSLQMEDVEGTHLTGKDAFVILLKALEAKKGNARNRESEGRRRYQEYEELKKERKGQNVSVDGAFDRLCVGVGMCILVVCCGFLWLWCKIWTTIVKKFDSQ